MLIVLRIRKGQAHNYKRETDLRLYGILKVLQAVKKDTKTYVVVFFIYEWKAFLPK